MACHGSDVFFNEIRGDAMNRHIRPAPAPLAGGCTEFGPLRSCGAMPAARPSPAGQITVCTCPLKKRYSNYRV